MLTVCVLSFLACFVGNFLACMPFSRRFTADRKGKWYFGPSGGHTG